MKKFIGILLLVMLSSVSVLQAQDAARTAPPDPSAVQLVTVVKNFDRILFATGSGDGSGRLFVVEQIGSIWIVKDGATLPTPFLDVTGLVSRDVRNGGYTERGLLGLAFSPDYANNGVFFINYTDLNNNTVVARYHVSADNPDLADPDSAVTILTQEQPYENHNGGNLQFGPDGYLYIGFGDGGSGGDPQRNGQNLSTWLGKILRIDVSGDMYTVPANNPFVNTAGAKPEIWAYGVRNPWRFTFDRLTGDLWIGEVGQDQWEEVDFQPAASPGGENYGWSAYEATHPYRAGSAPADNVLPVAEYSHSLGISVTGGYVYRGSKIPDLVGAYLYGDFGSGTIWSLYRDANGAWQNNVYMQLAGTNISSFGQDDDGELYVVNYGGSVLRLEPAS